MKSTYSYNNISNINISFNIYQDYNNISILNTSPKKKFGHR